MLTKRQNSPQRPSGIGASAEPPQLHPLSIVRMFWKHQWQILLVGIVLSAIAAGIVYRLPVAYRAEATILVDSQRIPDKYVMSTVNTAIEDRVLTLKKEILAYDSLQAIIDRFNLYRDQRRSLSQEEILDLMVKDTQVDLEKGWTRDRPGAFRISYEGADPQVVAEVANDIANTFITKNIRTRGDRATQTSRFLTDLLEQAKAALDRQEKVVSDYKVKHNGELPEQEGSIGAILNRLQLELQGNQDAINRAQQQKLAVENSISVAESSLATMMSMTEQSADGGRPNADAVDPAASRSPKESEVLQARLDLLRVRYSDDHPEVKRLRAEIAQLRESESRVEAKQTAARPSGPAPATPGPGAAAPLRVSPEIADKLVKERERLADLKSSLALANRELEIRNAERQKIIGSIRDAESRLGRLPVHEQEMAGITRDYEISKENYKSLLDKKISADMASQMEDQQQGEKFTLLQGARPPETPSKPNRPLWVGVGCLVGFLISLVIAALREMRAGALLGEWELPSDVAVLGRVPWIAIEQNRFDTQSEAGPGNWLRRRGWQALVFSVVLSLVCGIAAAYYQGWMKF